MNIKTILIDDCRDLTADVIFRNGEAAIEFFKSFGYNRYKDFECVMFDYDLGNGVNGNFVLHAMLDMGYRPKFIELVTGLPVGLERMQLTIEDTKEYTKHPGGRYYERIAK